MITAERERELIARAKAGDREAAGELLTAHEYFWRRMAGRYGGKDPEAFDDAMQEIRLAAFEAIPDFDLSRGLRFLTFVGRKIKWRLSNWRWSDTLIRAARVANFDRLTAESKERAKRAARPSSLNDLIYPKGGGDAERSTLVADDGDDASGECLRAETIDRVRRALSELDARGRAVLLARLNEETLIDIGKSMGVSRERVRQLETRALDRMRFLLTSPRRQKFLAPPCSRKRG